jgi:predicted HAD superfamily Cof-like phosphohydrolase
VTNPFQDQSEFMQAAGQTTNRYNAEQTELYINLVVEEFKECVEAESLEQYVKEICDLIVVSIGTLHSLGVDAEDAWRRVHASNMSKLPFEKDPVSGKVQKGPNYVKPDMRSLIEAIPNIDEVELEMTEEELNSLELDLSRIKVADIHDEPDSVQ